MLHVEALRHKGVLGAEVRQEGIQAALVVLSMSRGPIAIALAWDALEAARYGSYPNSLARQWRPVGACRRH